MPIGLAFVIQRKCGIYSQVMPVIISGLFRPVISRSHQCCPNDWSIIRTIAFDSIVLIVAEQILSISTKANRADISERQG